MEADWLMVPPPIPAVIELQLGAKEPLNMPKPPGFGVTKMDSPPATNPPVPMPPQVVTNSPVALP
jgi:hypothetical protein